MYNVYKVEGGVPPKHSGWQLNLIPIFGSGSLADCLSVIAETLVSQYSYNNVTIYIHEDSVRITAIHHFPKDYSTFPKSK